jgi:hypothetical protein
LYELVLRASLFGMLSGNRVLPKVLRGNRQEPASDFMIQVRGGGMADPVEAF